MVAILHRQKVVGQFLEPFETSGLIGVFAVFRDYIIIRNAAKICERNRMAAFALIFKTFTTF